MSKWLLPLPDHQFIFSFSCARFPRFKFRGRPKNKMRFRIDILMWWQMEFMRLDARCYEACITFGFLEFKNLLMPWESLRLPWMWHLLPQKNTKWVNSPQRFLEKQNKKFISWLWFLYYSINGRADRTIEPKPGKWKTCNSSHLDLRILFRTLDRTRCRARNANFSKSSEPGTRFRRTDTWCKQPPSASSFLNIWMPGISRSHSNPLNTWSISFPTKGSMSFLGVGLK